MLRFQVDLHRLLTGRRSHRVDVKVSVSLTVPGINVSMRSDETTPESDRVGLQVASFGEEEDDVEVTKSVRVEG